MKSISGFDCSQYLRLGNILACYRFLLLILAYYEKLSDQPWSFVLDKRKEPWKEKSEIEDQIRLDFRGYGGIINPIIYFILQKCF